MKRLFVLISLCCAVIFAKGQILSYGQIDIDDLKLTTCDFEKSASAMVLCDRTEVAANKGNSIIKRHTEIKVLLPKSLKAVNFTLYYYTKGHFAKIKNLKGHLNPGCVSIRATPVGKLFFYEQKPVQDVKSITFITLPAQNQYIQRMNTPPSAIFIKRCSKC